MNGSNFINHRRGGLCALQIPGFGCLAACCVPCWATADHPQRPARKIQNHNELRVRTVERRFWAQESRAFSGSLPRTLMHAAILFIAPLRSAIEYAQSHGREHTSTNAFGSTIHHGKFVAEAFGQLATEYFSFR